MADHDGNFPAAAVGSTGEPRRHPAPGCPRLPPGGATSSACGFRVTAHGQRCSLWHDILLPPRLRSLAHETREVGCVEGELGVHGAQLLGHADDVADAPFHCANRLARVKRVGLVREVHHALLLVDGGGDASGGNHGDDARGGLLRRAKLGGGRDVIHGEGQVGLCQAEDVAPHQGLHALLGQAQVVLPLKGGLVLVHRCTEPAQLARAEGLGQLGVRRDARLEEALDRQRGVLWLLGRLAAVEQRRQHALLVRLNHHRVHHVGGRRVAEGEVLCRQVELFETTQHHPGVVVVQEQVARGAAGPVLVHLQQLLVEHRLRRSVAPCQQHHPHELGVDGCEVGGGWLQDGGRVHQWRNRGDRRRNGDCSIGKLGADNNELCWHHLNL
mmetsp:Transcript_20805/g.67403  ORF Transcript_20805/g.67403 Transcript_20805/m.67403 type:complete len:385 (+) Transcript_20805:775-1929(+)